MLQQLRWILNRLTPSSRKMAQMTGAFMADMSHEIRTPLTAVIGLSDILLKDDTDPLVEKQRDKFIAAINRGGKEALAVWDDVVTVHWLAQGLLQLTFGEIDLTLFLEDLVVKVPQYYRLKHRSELKIELISEGALKVQADPHRLGQALTWLLAEFIYPFDEEEGQDIRTVIRLVKKASWISLEMTTSGKGGGWDQVDTNPMLFFSKMIIQQHQGHLQFRRPNPSEAGFTITLPACSSK